MALSSGTDGDRKKYFMRNSELNWGLRFSRVVPRASAMASRSFSSSSISGILSIIPFRLANPVPGKRGYKPPASESGSQ